MHNLRQSLRCKRSKDVFRSFWLSFLTFQTHSFSTQLLIPRILFSMTLKMSLPLWSWSSSSSNWGSMRTPTSSGMTSEKSLWIRWRLLCFDLMTSWTLKSITFTNFLKNAFLGFSWRTSLCKGFSPTRRDSKPLWNRWKLWNTEATKWGKLCWRKGLNLYPAISI